MRIVGLGLIVGLIIADTASAQSPPLHGDFDGDGKIDTVAWVASDRSCSLEVRIAARPDTPFVLIETQGDAACAHPLDVRGAGAFTTKEIGGERQRAFASDVILSVSRPGVRSLKYWKGADFAGTWIPD